MAIFSQQFLALFRLTVSTVNKCAPQAVFCIDPYHVVTWALDAMDRMRRRIWREAYEAEKTLPKRKAGRPKKGEEPQARESKALRYSKYPLGKNPENLTDDQKSSLEQIQKVYPKLFRGYQLKEALRMIFHATEGVEEALKKWLSWACRCRIPEFVELNKKIRRHRYSILNTIDTVNLKSAKNCREKMAILCNEFCLFESLNSEKFFLFFL